VFRQVLRGYRDTDFYEMLENPGIPLPFRIQTVSQKVLDLEFKVLDEIIYRYKPEKNSHLNN
jgi:hypothetical protein